MALAVVLLLGPMAGTAAAEDVGVAYRGWSVQEVEVLGVESSVSREIKDGLALAKRDRSLVGRLRRVVYQPELLADDVQRVRLYLATRGYPHVRVDPTFEPNETRRRVTVVLNIHPGPRVLLGDIQILGLPANLSVEPTVLGIARDDPLVDSQLIAAQRAVLGELLENGYAAADVQRRLELVDSTRAHVHFDVTPGDVYVVRDVTFDGSSEDLRKLAKKTIGVKPGDVSTPKSLADGSKRLQQLGLFRRIDFDAPKLGSGEIDLKCQLTNRDPRTIEAGIGAWSDGIIQGRAAWSHRNLLRSGRGLGFRAIASKVEQEISAAVWQPSVLGPQTRATGIVRGRLEDEESYNSSKVEFETNLNVSFDLDRDHYLQTAVVLSFADYTGNTEDVQQQDGRLVTGQVTWLNDASDDRFYPRKGFVIQTEVESTLPGLGSQTDFGRAGLKAVYYQPLPRSSTLALRVSPGFVDEYAGGSIPPDRLFYGGGALSMRGFKRRELGPRDAKGTPTGGRVALEFSGEIRTSGFWKLIFAGFIDVAQVWVEPSDVRLDEMEVAIGPGLGFKTPIGPVRGDLGYRLTDFDTTQPSYVFHFYIGNPF